MAWRAMQSLYVLRDQVNALAPYRLKGADGLVGDEAHQATTSDHNPHYVAGVGADIVTALDLTHDPDHGFDSYLFAEVLRRNRDKRAKYVISNSHIFSSYAVSGYAAWTWRPYGGVDPHTGHVHVSTLDAVISDTSTPWDLEGLDDMSEAEVITGESSLWDRAANRSDATGRNFANDVYKTISDALGDEFGALGQALAAGFAQMAGAVSAMQSELDEIKAALPGSTIPGTAPVPIHLTGTISGTVSGSFSGQSS